MGGEEPSDDIGYEGDQPMMTIGVLTLASALAAVPVKTGTEIGQAYPVELLPSMDEGTPLSVARFRGQKVVLHQFASW